MMIIARVQRLADQPFDGTEAAAALCNQAIWSAAERRVVPIFLLVLGAWIAQPWLEPMLPDGALTDGTIAVAGSLLLFILPDGTGRPLLLWKEADRKSVGSGKSVAVSVDLGGRRIIKKKKKNTTTPIHLYT